MSLEAICNARQPTGLSACAKLRSWTSRQGGPEHGDWSCLQQGEWPEGVIGGKICFDLLSGYYSTDTGHKPNQTDLVPLPTDQVQCWTNLLCHLFSLPIQAHNNLVLLGHQLKRTLVYYRVSLLSGSQQRTIIHTLVKRCLHLPENILSEDKFLQQEAGWKEESWKYSRSVQHWSPLSHTQFSGHKRSGQSSRCYWLCHQIGSQHI